jgi:hypothetical protein
VVDLLSPKRLIKVVDSLRLGGGILDDDCCSNFDGCSAISVGDVELGKLNEEEEDGEQGGGGCEGIHL